MKRANLDPSADTIMKMLPIASVLILAGCSSGMSVEVANETHSSLAPVRLEFTGGSTEIETLQPGRTATFKLRPKGESSAILVYRDASGRDHRCDLDLYVEPGYVGTVSAAITPAGCQKRADNTRISIF